MQDLLDLLAFQEPQEIPEVRDFLEVPEAGVSQDLLVNQDHQVHQDLKVPRVRQTLLLAYYLHIAYLRCRKHFV